MSDTVLHHVHLHQSSAGGTRAEVNSDKSLSGQKLHMTAQRCGRGARCAAECIESVLSTDRDLLCRLAAGGEMQLMCETLDQRRVWEKSQVRRAENNNAPARRPTSRSAGPSCGAPLSWSSSSHDRSYTF